MKAHKAGAHCYEGQQHRIFHQSNLGQTQMGPWPMIPCLVEWIWPWCRPVVTSKPAHWYRSSATLGTKNILILANFFFPFLHALLFFFFMDSESVRVLTLTMQSHASHAYNTITWSLFIPCLDWFVLTYFFQYTLCSCLLVVPLSVESHALFHLTWLWTAGICLTTDSHSKSGNQFIPSKMHQPKYWPSIF